MELQSLQYVNQDINQKYNRLLVKPAYAKEAVTDNGVVIPPSDERPYEYGEVTSVCPGSAFKTGDQVVYKKIDRSNKGDYDFVRIEGEEYDAIFENEVWAHNEEPVNRLFVEPISEMEVTESGIEVSPGTEGYPQKGLIAAAPAGSPFKKGDIIRYRKMEQRIYPTVNINGKLLEVLFETDVFLHNDKVSPYRVIVRIDVSARDRKRKALDTGVAISPLFLFMKYNMQVGEVMEIGEFATETYPDMQVGDMAILHHSIEAHGYRLLKVEKDGSGKEWEYRVLDAFNRMSREVFGRIAGKGKQNMLIPYGGNVFMEWEIELFHKNTNQVSALIDFDFSLDKCDNIDRLKENVAEMRKRSVEMYTLKSSALRLQLGQLHPETNPIDQDRVYFLNSQIEELMIDAAKRSAYVNANHLVVCKSIAHEFPREIICTYKELYPINILGKLYLIANEDFTIAKTITTMTENAATVKLFPLGSTVLVRPDQAEESAGQILIPKGGVEIPIRGTIVALGAIEDGILKENDTVIFKRGAGIPISTNGEKLLYLHKNDLLCKIS